MVKFWKNKFYSVENLREKVKIVVKLGTSHSSAIIVQTTKVEITVTQPEEIIACNVASRAMIRKIASNSRKEAQNGYASNFNGNSDRRNYESQDIIFTAISRKVNLTGEIWICSIGACGHYCNSDKGLSNFKGINENITVGNFNFMKGTKVGSLKYQVVQLGGLSVNVILQEIKYALGFRVNLFSISK
jgi:hypothetical protein